MRSKAILLLLIVLTFYFTHIDVTHAQQYDAGPSRYVLVWMGLEVVGENVESSLEQLRTHINAITAVSYEAYVLRPGGMFDRRVGVTDVTEDLRKMKVELWPMITSADIDNMRTLFSNPEPFITAAVNLAISRNFTGYNIDFEPSDATANDAYNYVIFLNKFADALHSVNKKLSVDIASWSLIWDYNLLAESKVDYIYDMSTYAGRFETFYTNLNNAISKIPMQKLGIGLETLNPNTGEKTPFTEGEIEARIRSIIKSGVNRIAIWRTPLPDFWWTLLEDFKNGFNIVLNISTFQPLVGTNITIKTKTIGGIEPFTYIWKLNNLTLDCTTSICNIKINNTNTQTLTVTVIDGLYINTTKTIIISPITTTKPQSYYVQQNIQTILILFLTILLVIIIIILYKKSKIN